MIILIQTLEERIDEKLLYLEKMQDDLVIINKLLINLLGNIDEIVLENNEKETIVHLYDEWVENKQYKIGKKFSFSGELYEVLQSHSSQENWVPDGTPALYKKIIYFDSETLPEWKQPVGGHDAYNTGDKVTFEGKGYESLIDANVWNPKTYSQGWKVVG